MIEQRAGDATSEGVRQRNLARLLRLVHVDGPLSRAALTEATGLNRSTIADLVAELVREGLVDERAPDPSRRVGRPSPVVGANARVVAVAANPEVDALTVAIVGLDRSIRHRERIDLDHLLTPTETAALIAERTAAWREANPDARIVAVGLAVPGLVRTADGLVRNAPHLHWTDAPLQELVTDATGLPAVIGNDASLGVLAEALFGAARGIDDVVYLNGGASGIGGGLMIGGMPVPGAGGYAGEFGQNRPGIGAPGDRTAEGGVLEDEVSHARLLAALDLASADDATLAAALDSSSDDAVAAEVERQRRILSTALANAVNVLNPSVVVLGGFLASLASLDTPALIGQVAAQAMPANMEGLEIRVAALADDRLLIGAAEVAFGELLRDPAAS